MRSQHLLAAAVAALCGTSAQSAVQISTAATQNMNCAGGVCTPTAANAVLNTTDLTNMLSTADVKVVTGSGALAIQVMSPFSWASTHRLTLDAHVNVSFRAAVQVAGQGAVTIVTNDGGTGGDLVFFPGGKLDFSDTGSSLIINENAYTLVGNVATLAADIAGNASGFYALAQDYDATPDGQYDGAPIATNFFGGFDGLGHAISNLSMRSDDDLGLSLGLFAQSSGTIRNTNLVNANVSATSSVSGGLTIGSLVGDNVGIIKYSSATNGTVAETNSTDGAFGGLVGTNGGQIISSSAAMTVTGVYAGGLAGDNKSVITDSFAAGTVKGQAAAGGIVAVNYDEIFLSHTSGAVSAKRPAGDAGHSFIGGLAGWNLGGKISQSYSTGQNSGVSHVVLGGLVGWNTGGTVTQSYAIGTTQASKGGNIGGIIGTGDMSSKVTQVYSAGPTGGAGKAILGGVIGRDRSKAGNVSTAYWDLDTTGIADPQKGAGDPLNAAGITGLSDAQLKSGLPAGFDPAIWAIKKKINNGYPYLIANHPPAH